MLALCTVYTSTKEEEQDDFIYVAYNAYWEPHEFALPKLPGGMKWQIAIHTEEMDAEKYPVGEPLPKQRNIDVPARSVVVLLGKQELEE